MSNFTFLKEKWPILENLGRLAERNLYIDSNTTLNTGSFKAQDGGFDRLNEKLFNGNLGDIITKLKTYMFENIS